MCVLASDNKGDYIKATRTGRGRRLKNDLGDEKIGKQFKSRGFRGRFLLFPLHLLPLRERTNFERAVFDICIYICVDTISSKRNKYCLPLQSHEESVVASNGLNFQRLSPINA